MLIINRNNVKMSGNALELLEDALTAMLAVYDYTYKADPKAAAEYKKTVILAALALSPETAEKTLERKE